MCIDCTHINSHLPSYMGAVFFKSAFLIMLRIRLEITAPIFPTCTHALTQCCTDAVFCPTLAFFTQCRSLKCSEVLLWMEASAIEDDHAPVMATEKVMDGICISQPMKDKSCIIVSCVIESTTDQDAVTSAIMSHPDVRHVQPWVSAPCPIPITKYVRPGEYLQKRAHLHKHVQLAVRVIISFGAI